jgi:hypothetical protein
MLFVLALVPLVILAIAPFFIETDEDAGIFLDGEGR